MAAKQNRLLQTLQTAKRKKRKLFSAFLTLGFPNLKTTEHLLHRFRKIGVDIVELGFPFSDPLADGPTIQYSSQYALDHGVKIRNAFKLVAKIRRQGNDIPIVFFTYLNPVYHYGLKAFVRAAKRAGFDGLLIPDSPPEEEGSLRKECVKAGLPQIYLIAPTTKDQRAKKIAKASQGFIYYVSLRGVTGARRALPSDVRNHVKKLKRFSSKPILIGFGVSNPSQVRELVKTGDGIIVGSAIVDCLKKSKGRIEPVTRFVKSLVTATKGN